MRLTQQWMIDTYNELNEKYFDNEITSEAICLVEHSKKNKTYGCYHKVKKSITLYDRHDEVETSWKETLCHEMIHKLFDDNNINCVHGKEFKAKANEITKRGMLITTKVCYTTSTKDNTIECLTKEEKLANNTFLDYVKVTEKGRLFAGENEFVDSTYDIVRDICEDKTMSKNEIFDLLKKLKGKKMPTTSTTTTTTKKTDWRSFIQWKQDKYGEDLPQAENIAKNYLAYIENNPKFKDRLKYNEYRKQIEFNYGTEEKPNWNPISDIVYNKIHSDIDNDLRLSSRPKVEDAISLAADNNRYHEVINYFNSLTWDHIPRVETFFIDWLKADDTPLNREMTKIWLIGGVKRIVEPGCKFDNILITIGQQGSGKTSLIERLSNGFGCVSNIKIDKEQEYGQKLDNTWIAVFDELASLNKKEATDIKSWFSITMDTFRVPWGRVPEVHKRHCIYYGTTNDWYFLRDYTARCERRYWTILCHQTKEESWEKLKNFTQEVIDQIWAEAVYLYQQNPDIALDITAEYYDMLEEVQQQFRTSNEDNVAETLENLLNQEYILDENGLFKSDRDCIDQMKGKTRDMRSNEHIGHINIIPSRQIKLILKEVMHDVRKHNYFENETSGFGKRWNINVQDVKINSKVYKRVEFIRDEEKEVESMTPEDVLF